jgi:hypothetical protein
VLALLAFACVPVAAQADSGEVEYENALPKADGNGPSQNEQIAQKSDSPNGGVEANGSGGGGSNTGSFTEEEAPSEEGSAAGPGNGNGGSGQGKPDKSANPSPKAGVQGGAPLTHAGPASSGDGGSSPLVPIMIAIAALAAISIAVVLARQRRQRNGSGPSSLSTKAG